MSWLTFFPYTTLFRSPWCRSAAGPGEPSQLRLERTACNRRSRTRGDRSPQGRDTGRDRKSTRLNSSHVEISYAVFCLKKKEDRARRPHALRARDRGDERGPRRQAAPLLGGGRKRRGGDGPVDGHVSTAVAGECGTRLQ